MPIYEYECGKCKKRFEHLAKSARDLPSRCPACGGEKIEKIFSAFSVGAMQQTPSPSACASCPSAGCPHRGR